MMKIITQSSVSRLFSTTLKGLLLTALILTGSALHAQSTTQFTDGNLAAVVAAASANNTTASVIEVKPSTANQSAPVNTFAVGASDIRVSGSATSTLYVANSADGSQLLFTGHYSNNTSVNANTLLTRGVVRFKHAGGAYVIPTTYTGVSGNQTRSATTLDNTNYYIADQGGLFTNSSTAASQTTNLRGLKAFGSTVYGLAASSSTISVGTLGSPAGPTASTYTGLNGLSAESAAQDFYMISSNNDGVYDVLYILTATSNTAGIIKKYSLVAGTWTANGTYTTSFGGFGICARKESTSAQLYITTGQGALTANKIMRITDTAGYNAAISITTANNVTLYTAASGTIIKGIAFAPLATPPVVTSSLTATAQIGQSFSYQINTNDAVTSYSASGLPAGLSINTTTGVISGTPATASGSPVSVTISATNTEGTGTATLVITINKAPQTITFDPIANVHDNAADFNLTATASSGLAVTYVSSNTSVATVSGNTVHVVGVGSTDITASQAGNVDYLAATDVVQTLTVTSSALASQTITFPALADTVYGNAPFTASATASSGLNVTYTSSDTGIATVSGSTITVVGVGTVTIYADQAGNSSYNPASQVGQTFTVAAKSLTVTGAVVTAKTYDGTDVATITGATLVGVITGDTVTVSGNGVFADANAGDNKNVTPALVLGGTDSAKYTVVQPVLTGNIAKANQVITFGAISNKTTLDADFSAGATSATSGVNPITYTSSNTAVATISGSTIHIVGAGTSTITASQAESQNYNAVSTTQTLTVLEAEFTAGNIVVLRIGSGSAAPTSAANPVYFSEYTTGGTATLTIPVPADTAGSRLVLSGNATSEGQVNLSGDGQYLTIAGYDAAVGTLSIASSTATVANRVVARASANGQIAFTSLGTSAHSGNNIRSAATQDGSRYWTAGGNGGIFTTTHQGPAPTAIATNITNFRTVSVFGGQLYVSSASGTAGIYTVGTGLPTASTSASLNITSAEPYGYSVVDRGNGVRNMYIISATASVGLTKWVSTDGGAWSQVGGSVPVSSVSLYGLAARANGSNVEVYASSTTGVYSLTDTANGTTAISGTFTQIITAPTNTVFRGVAFAPSLVAPVITNTGLAISGNLNQPIADYTITAINAATSFNATGLPAGVTINTLTGVISGSPQHAGTFSVTISATNDAGTDSKTLTLTVAKGDQEIIFDALDPKDVNEADFDLTASSATSAINPIVYTSSNTAVATISGATVHIVGVGSTVITASQPATSDYNAAASVAQTQVITTASLAAQTITFDPIANKTYGDAPFVLTATASSGLEVTYSSSNASIATISGNTVIIHNTGTVSITASQPGDASYNAATDVVQSLTVLAKPLTVTGAAVTTKVYDGTATATVTGGTLEGIVSGDNVSLVSGSGTFSNVNAGTGIPVTSSFTLSGTEAYRYTVVQPTLTGTITKANQAITFAAFPIKSDIEPAITLTSFSTTSSINPVTYSSSSQTVASVTDNILSITGTGFATITASQAESQNYNAASVTQTLTVQPGLYLNQFTGASACPTNGNIAVTAANATGTEVTRSTITCNSTANVFNSTTLSGTAAANEASYIEFSVSAVAGHKLNLTSLYMMRKVSNSAPSQLEIRYSTDNFATYNSFTATPATATTANSSYSSTPSLANGDYTNWDFEDFSSTVGGTVTFRLYPYGTQRADGTGTPSTTGTFRIDDLTVFGTMSADCYEWTGTVSSSWTTAGNWCGNAVPSVYDDVTIAATATNPVITTGTANAHTLTMQAGATLTVSAGATLNVQDALTIDTTATLTVQDNAALTQGTSAVTNSNTGAIVFNKKSSNLYRLDYTIWSSPVAGQNLLAFSPATTSNRFYQYKSVTDVYATVDAASADFVAAKGYLIRMPNVNSSLPGYIDGTASMQYNGVFTGTPNNGTVTIPISIEGSRFSAVGNPYPSPINLYDFFMANAQALDPTSGIYFWRKRNNGASSSYAALSLSAFTANPAEGGGSENEDFYANPAQSDTWLIAPGQGFLVKASSGAASAPNLTFTNSMRRAASDSGLAFFRHAADTASRMWLNLTAQSGAGSQAAIAYMEGTTTGFDFGYDAVKFAEPNTLNLYSVANDTELTIQARPEFNVADVVALGYTAPAAASYTISLNRKDGVFTQGQNIYLKDNVAGTVTNLTETDYAFVTEAGTFNTRFEVVYVNEELGTDNPVLNPDSVVVYGKNGIINVNAGSTIINNVTVYDIRGAKIYSQNNINNTQTAITNLTAEQQVLILEVQTVNGKVNKRIVH